MVIVLATLGYAIAALINNVSAMTKIRQLDIYNPDSVQSFLEMFPANVQACFASCLKPTNDALSELQSGGGTTSSISYSEVYDLLDQSQHCLETTCVRLYLRISLPQWCAPLAAVVFLFWIHSTIRYAVLLLLMYSIQSEVDVSQKWWRQFLTIFEILSVSEVPWYKRPQFVILKVVAKGMGLVAGGSKKRGVARTKGT